MNRDDRIFAIVLASEHLLRLGGLHFLIEPIECVGKLGVHGFAGLGPLDEHRQILAPLAKGLDQISILLETTPALQNLLRLALIFPEIGL
jgi:hypothetical protein